MTINWDALLSNATGALIQQGIPALMGATAGTPGGTPAAAAPTNTAGGFNLNNFLGSAARNLLTPNNVTGAGLLLGSTLMDKEPGEITEARQFLRNRFTSPTALGDQFTSNLGAVTSSFEPLLAQRRKTMLDDVQQRAVAGQPQSFSAAMSGPELAGIRSAFTDQILPTEQAFLGEIGLNLLNAQERAASSILANQPDNGLTEALGQLGGSFLMRDMLRPGDGASLLNYSGTGAPQGPGGTGGAQSGATALLSNLSQAVGLANTTGNLGPLQALLASGALAGTPFPIGLQASTPAGQLVQQAINAGLVESPAARIVDPAAGGINGGAASGGFQGMLGAPGFSGAGIVSGLASGGSGAVIGNVIGKALQARGANDAVSGLGGAAGGAAAGFAVGGPIGGVIGAIAGGISSLFGASGQRSEQKEAARAADTAATNQARPQAVSTVKGALDDIQMNLPKIKALQTQYPQAFVDFNMPDNWLPGEPGLTATQAIGLIEANGSRIYDWLYKTDPGGGHEAITETSQMGQITPLVREATNRYNEAKVIMDALRQHLASKGIQGAF